MKQLLVYDQPLVLNREQHRHLRIKPRLESYHFAGALNSVPLTVTEFADASHDYPIVFAGEPDTASMPAVLLGLTQSDNLFVREDGQWEAESYIPAFLRRYPFVTAQQEQAGQFSVCIEQSFLSEADDAVPLFDESGAETPVLAKATKFLSEYQQAVERTQKFMERLRASHLLMTKTIQIERPGNTNQSLNGFCVVDEEHLQKLGGSALNKLARSGALGWIYAHLVSLGNVKRLARRMDMRQGTQLH